MSKLACLSIDIEPDLRCPSARVRLFDDDAKLERFCRFFAEAEIPLTGFVVMSRAEGYREPLAHLDRLLDMEFAVHSFSHDQSRPATPDEAARAWDAYGRIWGRPPRGYRAPNLLIDAAGLAALAGQGFLYDSSIAPSLRVDAYGYDNRRFPREPFRVETGQGTILELPVACTRRLRLPLGLGYLKLLGWTGFSLVASPAALPRVAVIYLHPYDFYVKEVARHTSGWKRYAHLRNADHAYRLLGRLVERLRRAGYVFKRMEEVAVSMAESPVFRL